MNTGATTIRDYAAADRPLLVELAREMQAAEASFYDRLKPPAEIGDWYIQTLLDACETKNGRILVATDGDTPIGYAVVLTHVTSEDEPDEIDHVHAFIQDIAVTERWRGRGVGSALLAACEDTARKAGVRWLRLSVLAENTRALGAYRKAGFQPLLSTMEKPLG